jgi:Flp pilus assembly protein TadD
MFAEICRRKDTEKRLMRYNAHQLAMTLATAGLAISLATGCASRHRPATSPAEVVVVDTSASTKAVADSAKLLSDGKEKQAREILENAVKADPNYGPLHNNLGIAYYREGRLYDAAREFDLAAKLMPTIAEPRNNLGMVMERAGRFEDAIAGYTKARDLQPDSAVYLGNLVRARIRRGDNDPAMHKLLEELLLKETRPEWQRWAREQLTLLDLRTRNLHAAPATAPMPVR